MIDYIKEYLPDAIVLDGLDDAIIGICSRTCAVIYSKDKIIDILAKEWAYEEAHEWYDYNIANAYYGEHSPIICEEVYG